MLDYHGRVVYGNKYYFIISASIPVTAAIRAREKSPQKTGTKTWRYKIYPEKLKQITGSSVPGYE